MDGDPGRKHWRVTCIPTCTRSVSRVTDRLPPTRPGALCMQLSNPYCSGCTVTLRPCVTFAGNRKTKREMLG